MEGDRFVADIRERIMDLVDTYLGTRLAAHQASISHAIELLAIEAGQGSGEMSPHDTFRQGREVLL